MNGTNELLRAILKIDEEERARTQATEEYRQKAQADKAAKAKQMEEQAMEDMRHDVDEFAQAEKARAEGELAAQAKRKQQILDQLDQQLQKNKDAWVDTILTQVLGGGSNMGNTQASNAILAKARAMYGRRLTARNYQELLNCRDLPDLISYLKTRTSYSEALQAANPATTHRAQLETLLRLNLFEQYASLCRYEMNIGHDFYRYFIIRSEVQAITTRLQELHAPDGDVSIYTMPDFIKKHSCLNLNAMSMATSFKMLVLALEGTPYAKILQPFADDPDFALENSGLLELEAALDSFVNSQVEQIASTKLSGKSKEEMLYLLRRQSDLRAIADIYRLKSVLRADRAFIKKRVSLSVSNMTPRQLDNLMDAQDAQDVIHRLVNTPYASEFYGASFDYIEEGVRKIDYRWHLKKLRFSTNPSVVLFCYIFLAENELTNIVHIIEGVRYGLAPDDIATLLVGVGD